MVTSHSERFPKNLIDLLHPLFLATALNLIGTSALGNLIVFCSRTQTGAMRFHNEGSERHVDAVVRAYEHPVIFLTALTIRSKLDVEKYSEF